MIISETRRIEYKSKTQIQRIDCLRTIRRQGTKPSKIYQQKQLTDELSHDQQKQITYQKKSKQQTQFYSSYLFFSLLILIIVAITSNFNFNSKPEKSNLPVNKSPQLSQTHNQTTFHEIRYLVQSYKSALHKQSSQQSQNRVSLGEFKRGLAIRVSDAGWASFKQILLDGLECSYNHQSHRYSCSLSFNS